MSRQLRYSKPALAPTVESVLLAPRLGAAVSEIDQKPLRFSSYEPDAGTPRYVDQGLLKAVEELLTQYLAYCRQDEWQRSADVLRELIKLVPHSSEAYFRLGLSYWNLEDYDRAASALEKAVKLDPSNVRAHFHLGTVYVTPYLKYGDTSKLRRAIKPVRRAIQAGVYQAMAYHYLGIIYEGLRNWRGAEENYQKAIELDPQLDAAYLKLADLYKQLGDLNKDERERYYSEAIATCQRLIEANPQDAGAYSYMGSAYEGLGKSDLAIEAYERALEINGNELFSLASLGIAYLDAERFAEARTVLERIIRTDVHSIADYVMGQRMERPERLNVFMADAHTNYGVACMELHRARSRRGERDEDDATLLTDAEDSFRKALEFDGDHVNALFDLAALYYRQGRLKEAEEKVRRLLKAAPDRGRIEQHIRLLLEEQLKQNLLEKGLVKEIREPISDFAPYQNRRPIIVEGRPVSETLVEERR